MKRLISAQNEKTAGKKKVKVRADVDMIVWVHESVNGDIEIEDVEEVTEIHDFTVKS